MKRSILLLYTLIIAACTTVNAQADGYWHGKERELRYTPQGGDLVIVNGDRKFNKALYGTNTAFRVETGDVPEFGLFMPNMGGNIELGLVVGDRSIWLNDAHYIKSIYRAGSRIYEIEDPIVAGGRVTITVLAMGDAEGVVIEVTTKDIVDNVELITSFGGASNKRFFRNGDLGVDDPLAFALKPEACAGNIYEVKNNTFSLVYGQGDKGGSRTIAGTFPEKSQLRLGSPYAMTTPYDAWRSTPSEDKPILLSNTPLATSGECYIVIKNGSDKEQATASMKDCFDRAEARRAQIAGTVKIETPDPYFNALGGIISTAADGIWEPDCWQHGAVGWRMPLNGWRAAYVGDAIGWHDRARRHFDGYAASQITEIEPTIQHPAQDKALNLARAEKTWGTQMYSNGYICRSQHSTSQMHHYDMNLSYIDELLWHFNWTGDMEYVRKMWPVLKRHLAWEKRNFDPNDDGLYDAYASIWASDALQYNSGGVTHSSSYNYRANRMAAKIAGKLGEDSKPYLDEASKILNAVNSQLWIEKSGWWAEYKDYMGNKIVHPNAGVWSIYHAIDSEIHTPFQSYQATRYIDTQIPHIDVLASGLEQGQYKTIATTNWLPYSWSVNNVAFAEVAHTSLAYWQAGRYDQAFNLFKSAVLDGMYMGGSPGNIGQISHYDAARGECYRDFGDPVGVYSRALIQGLFGIIPDAMSDRLTIRPGFPHDWNYASVSSADIDLDFKREGNKDRYIIHNRVANAGNIELLVKGQKENIKQVTVGGKSHAWSLEESVGAPMVKIELAESDVEVEIEWTGAELRESAYRPCGVKGEQWSIDSGSDIDKVYDPQGVLAGSKTNTKSVSGVLDGEVGYRTLFVEREQGQMRWWEPIGVEIKEAFTVKYNPESSELSFTLHNNASRDMAVDVYVNEGASGYKKTVTIVQNSDSEQINVPAGKWKFGSNTLEIKEGGKGIFESVITNWNLKNSKPKYEVQNIDDVINASVGEIFRTQYLTPRSPYTTLQLPTQGIGEWCHPTLMADIDDSGVRKAVQDNIFTPSIDIPFRTTGVSDADNIAFVSMWDNYPTELYIPIKGRASHAYFMMAGSTNHMQSHVVNGTLSVYYKDGSKDVLELINPETWLPIEQDFYLDGQAFRSKLPRPYRVALKTAVVSRDMERDMGVKAEQVYGRSIDGGAGVILDIALDERKELKNIELKANANDVVIGLMSVTLVR